MTDIVERLRDYGEEDAWSAEICKEAADEIERLRIVSDGHKKECIKLEARLEAQRDQIDQLRKVCVET